MRKKTKVAIFGSTSHIAKGLINNFLRKKSFSLQLYTLSPDKTRNFLGLIGKSPNKDCIIHKGYRDFLKYNYDIVINCVGAGTLNKLRGDYTKYFTVTEEYDNLVINYLLIYPGTLYISFSSGVVYGREFLTPAAENTINSIRVNHVIPQDYYSITRLNSEAKHRAFGNLKIIDLRLFSYFSRFADLTEEYFINEVMDCVLNKKILITDNANIVRDYVHPDDLFLLIRKCAAAGKLNAAFDVSSSRPVKKKEILDYFSCMYGLKYKIGKSLKHISATGFKNTYFSKYNNVTSLGYKPSFSSMDTLKQESKYILNRSYLYKQGLLK